ncbi:MAG: hypothetical protein R3B48_02375 [Kofleriaceae bacterium]
MLAQGGYPDEKSQENGILSPEIGYIRYVAVEIMILCLRPLPAMNGGWTAAKWRTPKLATSVAMRPVDVSAWLTGLAPEERQELAPILTAPFVAALRLEAPATAFEMALAYAEVVAEACAGVVVLGDDLVADHRASVEVWSGAEIETKWRALDAEAARADPGYQPVRDPTDDHRATQTFTFPIRLPGVAPAVETWPRAAPADEAREPEGAADEAVQDRAREDDFSDVMPD